MRSLLYLQLKIFRKQLRRGHTRMVHILHHTSKQVFGKYLFLTNTLSGAGLMAAGDLAMQLIESNVMYKDKPKVPIDWLRTGRMSIVGGLFGVFGHGWYGLLDRSLPGISARTIGKKILCEQFVASPVMLIIFFGGMGALEGRSARDTTTEFCDKFWMCYKADWCLWPAAQGINFYFLKPKYRVLYVSFVSALWDIYLSWAKFDEKVVHEGSDGGDDGSELAHDSSLASEQASEVMQDNSTRGDHASKVVHESFVSDDHTSRACPEHAISHGHVSKLVHDNSICSGIVSTVIQDKSIKDGLATVNAKVALQRV